MKVGFTGTSDGMTPSQIEQLRWVLIVLAYRSSEPPEFHHGASTKNAQTNSDLRARDMAVEIGYIDKPHPPKAYTSTALLARNHEIVAAADILIAAPSRDEEELRSGTWATVRYMRALRKPVLFLSRGK